MTAATPMNMRTLLGYRLRALSRRLSLSSPLSWFLLLLTLGLAGLLVYGTSRLAAGHSDELSIRDATFWLGAALTLIYSYTSFEVFFRASDARFFDAMPLRPETRFSDLFLKALALHLPLLVVPLGYAFGHAQAGRDDAALYTLAYSLGQFAYGLPLAISVHLFAGKSLLTPSSQVRSLLASNTVVSEAAVLLYAPALALLANLAISIFLDLALRDGLLRQTSPLTWPALGLSLGLGFICWQQARTIAKTHLYRMLPRFHEVDITPPYREDGVQRHVPQERLLKLLPEVARPYALRDLRQLRRRYRLDRMSVYAYPLVAYLMLSDTTHTFQKAHELLAIWVGVLLVSAFRFKGEISALGLEASLPINTKAQIYGRLFVSLLYPLMTWVWHVTICGIVIGVDIILEAASLGFVIALGLPFLAHLLALWVSPLRQTLIALVFKLTVTSLALTLGALL